MISYFSDITCGEACWSAREDICKCSCGGKNHGILLTSDGTRPMRSSKISGYRYELKAIGKYSEISEQVRKINEGVGPYKIEKFFTYCFEHQMKDCTPECKENHTKEYKYYYDSSDRGAPAKFKCASKQQIDKWTELENYKKLDRYELIHNTPYLLWEKVQVEEVIK